ncbi:MAG: hypothetical protein Q4A83_04535 [Bacillota bacterium]|nr:hypothetical protein [Bacillota bacterium]
MKEIIDFVEGRLSYEEIEAELYINPELWDWVQALVPQDIEDPKSEFRKRYDCKYNEKAFEANCFKVKPTVLSFGFNKVVDPHTLFSVLVQNSYPEIVPMKPPENSMYDEIERMKLDYISSEETEDYIRSILCTCADKPLREKKRILKEAFFIKPAKYPRWAQESEWPMSNGCPMKFVSQKQDGDRVEYLFEDDTTGETKVVEQFY